MTRSIAIVGNGSFSSKDASIIDDCDVVVRFNDCRSVGAGGIWTDVVGVCNTGRPALSMVRQRSWLENAAVVSATELLCVRDSSKFAELRKNLDPDLNDFCDDYTAEFASFAADTGKAFKTIPRHHHDRIDIEISKITSIKYVVPSSGLMVITYFLEEAAGFGDQILLAGFDHCGWSGHPFDAERLLIEGLIYEGRLQRIGVPQSV